MAMHYSLPEQQPSIEEEILSQIDALEYEEQLVNEFIDTFFFSNYSEEQCKYFQ